VLEGFYHRQVCSGQLGITAAQRAMAQDRFSVEEDDLFPV
jgi:hypothetical protein